jgi:rRNA maturation protein Nop10
MQTTWSVNEENAKLFLRGIAPASGQQSAQNHPDRFSPKMANKWQ